MIRVLLADDQELVRTGFRMIVDAQADMRVIGEAGDGGETIAAAERLRPDVVLLDIRMPGMDGLAAIPRLVRLAQAPRIVVLTTFDLDEYVFEALAEGASGFLLKGVPADQLLAGIRAAAAGDALIDPSVTRRLVARFLRRRPMTDPGSPDLSALTEREREVLELLARGLSNAEIADRLVVSAATVKTHVARVLSKLGLRDRVQAVILAYEAGVVTPRSGADPASG
ncbi:MAG TPA: response regulator transcription factor [Gaiellales bacterium]|jgi:DNA-binding NarL/FixJ family response regulator|nr:response regulator transcription factor [Gaiellales bacterium]